MTRQHIAAVAAAVALTVPAATARGQAGQAVVEKGRAPISSELLKISLPRPQHADLSNGLHVLVLEDRRAPQVTMQLIVRGAGGYFDPADHLGKAQTRAQLLQQRANPGFLAQERFSMAVAGTHPDGRTAPAMEALDKTTRESLAAFHKTRYVPDHGVIALTGDISLAEAVKKLEARFASWKKAGTPAPRVSDPEAITKPSLSLVARPNSVQTSLMVGTQAIRRSDPDFYAMTVMNKVIGGGPTGRLFRHLREEKGYTYGAGSNVDAPRWTGVWVASTTVRNEVTEPALNDLMDEIRQMREIPVPAKEFADSKRSLVAAFALTLESPQAQLQNAILQWRHGLPADYWDRYPERIMAITDAEVQAVAKKYLDPSRLQIVAVGNEEAVARALRKYGAVDVYDADGKKVRTY